MLAREKVIAVWEDEPLCTVVTGRCGLNKMATKDASGESVSATNNLLIEGTFYCQGKLGLVKVQQGGVQWTCKGKSRFASFVFNKTVRIQK